jgi:hypothetical protein
MSSRDQAVEEVGLMKAAGATMYVPQLHVDDVKESKLLWCLCEILCRRPTGSTMNGEN